MLGFKVKGILLALVAMVATNAPALAGLDIQSDKRYYITCNYADGFACLGAYQGVSCEVYYQTNSSTITADGYWRITQDGGGYTFQNCMSGQYLSWTETHQDNCKYLTLVSEVSGNNERWTITEGNGFVSIRSVAQPSYQFNLRKDGTYLLGCYESTSTDNNEQFNICEVVSVEDIAIEASGTRLEVGETLQLSAIVSPADATISSITWSSDDEAVATVGSGTGLVTALAKGEATITATADDGSGVQASVVISVVESAYVEHGDGMLYVRRTDGTVLVIPRDYVGEYTLSGDLFSATLVDGEPLELTAVAEAGEDTPADLPSFSSYKFNNKYNSQVFTDVESEAPGGTAISLSVGCIGKWLTASFQFNVDGTEAWVGGVRQRSKKTRQSFAQPVTYELTNSLWRELRLRREDDGTYAREYADFVRKVTVSVDFLADHPTGEYGVPRVDITLANTASWGSGNWIGMHGKTYYEDATIAIDGAGVYPDMSSTPIQIKGRGNSSWSSSYNSKNPYHFKFEEKRKPLGMKNGKHWILLSNKIAGSMTTNAIGHKVGNLLETAGTNHIVPVELYINGSYRGSYNLTERVGFGNNSIDIDDETNAAMIELDTYTDETIYKTNAYGLPAKIHKPDLSEDDTQLTADIIMSDFDGMMAAVKTGTDSYLHQVDADHLARYLLACECIINCELKHPKSAYLYSENVTDGFNLSGDDETPWVFGPLWDCDWAFGYENHSNYYIGDAELDFFTHIANKTTAGGFWKALRYDATEVDSLYYKLAYDFVNGGGVDEMVDYCDEYYAFATRSFAHNTSNATSERDGSNYATVTENTKSWFAKRASYILSKLTPYDIEDEEDDDDGLVGDVNDDGVVGVADLVCLLNYLLGIDNETFLVSRADTDDDGKVNASDVETLCDMIMAQATDASRNQHMPDADASMKMEDTECYAESEAHLPLTVSVDEGEYSALQMDLHLPDGVELDGVELPSELGDMTARTHLTDSGKYRILVYADGSCTLPLSPVTIQLRIMTGESLSDYAYITGASASTSRGEEERLPSVWCTLAVVDDMTAVRGVMGETVRSRQASGAVYDLSGRPVGKRQAERQHGVYIIDGRKVVR